MSNQVREGYKQTEIGVIPEDWMVVSISEIANIAIGKDVNEAHFSTEQDNKYKHPVYSNTVENEGLYGYYDYAEFHGDSLTVVGRGVGLGTAFGRGGSYGAIGRLVIIFPRKQCNNRFLADYINHKVNVFSESSGVPQLTGLGLAKYKVALPPIEEQSAIAQALSDVDALIAALDKLIAKKRDLKTATMQHLLTGKKRLPGFGEGKSYKESAIGLIPEDWKVKTYGDIFSFLTTASNSRADLCLDEKIKYIHYGDIHTKWDFKIDLVVESLPSISQEKVKGAAFIKTGDVVVADASEDYEGVGKSVEVINVSNSKVIAGLHTFLLRDENEVFIHGFRGYIHAIEAVKKSLDRMATGLKVYGISKNNLKTIFIPVPSKEEQRAIALVLSDMDNAIALLESRLTKTQAIKQGMMQELLTGRTRLI